MYGEKPLAITKIGGRRPFESAHVLNNGLRSRYVDRSLRGHRNQIHKKSAFDRTQRSDERKDDDITYTCHAVTSLTSPHEVHKDLQ